MVYFVPACVWPGSWVDFESCSCIGACTCRAYACVCMPIHIYIYIYIYACKCMHMHACTSICMPMRYACICEHMHAYISSIGSLQGHCILWPWSYLSLVLFSIYLKPACIVGNSDGAIAVGCRGAAMLVQSIGISAHL